MRDVDSLRGIHSLRTMHSTKRRSIPRVQSSAYLDLYMLKKEKERLQKEEERLSMRDEGIKKRVEEIDLEMAKMQEAEAAKPGINVTSRRTFTENKGVVKEWKKMPLNY